MAAETPGGEAEQGLEVLWWDALEGRVARLVLPHPGPGTPSRTLWPQLPTALRLALEQGHLEMASHGRILHPDDLLRAGDRLELLGPIAMDVRAERAARVIAVRARSRNPYNRTFREQA